ncbi:MAG: hypothetical protein H6858_06850 [Rhodospirillales bacterium]|nr:hypothetical protein [Alphaproteobacteria bacterium]MCB1838955.1 hypothetical protein [Alphaproteobacteria bacterium]MCB9977297.1 hypothetical protein [Rhodospirillales bacterium]
MAKKQNQPLVSSASIVDGKLILSLPDAYTPVVWQMDLEQAKSSALQVKEDVKNNRFNLCLKTLKGEVEDIASYEDRASAIQALMATSNALENAHGKIRPQAIRAANHNNSQPAISNASPARFSSGEAHHGGKAGAVLAVVMILLLVMAWSFSIPRSTDSILSRKATSSSASSEETGVPVSADDFLSRRQN